MDTIFATTVIIQAQPDMYEFFKWYSIIVTGVILYVLYRLITFKADNIAVPTELEKATEMFDIRDAEFQECAEPKPDIKPYSAPAKKNAKRLKYNPGLPKTWKDA